MKRFSGVDLVQALDGGGRTTQQWEDLLRPIFKILIREASKRTLPAPSSNSIGDFSVIRVVGNETHPASSPGGVEDFLLILIQEISSMTLLASSPSGIEDLRVREAMKRTLPAPSPSGVGDLIGIRTVYDQGWISDQ